MSRRAQFVILAILILLVALAWAFPRPAGADVPAGRSILAPSEFSPLSVVLPSSVGSATVAPRSAGHDTPRQAIPALQPRTSAGGRDIPTREEPAPSPSLRVVPRLAAVVRTQPHIGLAPGASVTGEASWFASPIGVSAAGPALRAALGANWRGTLVKVTGPHGFAWTILGDWMARDRLIDLDVNVFPAVCGPLSRGICEVEVSLG
jgi:hypothetical protein